jgi:hypothetical protein
MPSFSGLRRRAASRGRWRSLQPYLLAGLFAVALAAGAATPPPVAQTPVAPQQPATAPPPAGAPGRPPPGPGAVVPGQGAQSPLDEPLRLVAEARQTYQRVQSYTCTLISQERVRGQLKPENVITLTFRAQPFSVHMRWQGPKEFAGQEVVYVHGRNDGKMRVNTNKGLNKMVGFVSIAPDDPRVMEHSNHTITETGIGNVIERLARAWQADRPSGKVRVQMAEYEYAQRRCVRVEIAQTERSPQRPIYRTAVYFDKQTRLPIRVENYGWPVQGGAPQGDLLECFSYINLQFNIPVNDAMFTR